MSKEIRLDQVAQKVDEIIDALDSGESVTIVHEGKPFTKVELPLEHRGVPYPFRDLEIAPLEKPLGVDPVEMLIEERERERSGKKYGL